MWEMPLHSTLLSGAAASAAPQIRTDSAATNSAVFMLVPRLRRGLRCDRLARHTLRITPAGAGGRECARGAADKKGLAVGVLKARNSGQASPAEEISVCADTNYITGTMGHQTAEGRASCPRVSQSL